MQEHWRHDLYGDLCFVSCLAGTGAKMVQKPEFCTRRPDLELFAEPNFTNHATLHSFEQPIGQSAQLHLVWHLPRAYSAAESERIERLPSLLVAARGGEFKNGRKLQASSSFKR